MKNKILYRFLPVFLVLVFFICPLNTYAAESGGTSYMWDGDLYFGETTKLVPLRQGYVSHSGIFNNDNVYATNQYLTYGSDFTSFIYLTGTTGTFLNGNAYTTYTFELENAFQSLNGQIDSSLSFSGYEGISIISRMYNVSSNRCVMQVFVTFDNFEITSPVMSFPIDISLEYALQLGSEVAAPAIYANVIGNDWTDSVRMYNSVEDLPGYKGFIGRAFDSIKTHLTSLFNGLKQNDDLNTDRIVDELSKQDSGTDEIIANQNANSQAQINQSKENTDQITNGYSDQALGNADTVFNQGAGELSDIEENLSSSSSQYIDDYADSAFDVSFLDTIGPSLNFVVTWFTNFWQIGGGLTATFTISFAIFIAFYIIRVRA